MMMASVSTAHVPESMSRQPSSHAVCPQATSVDILDDAYRAATEYPTHTLIP